MFVFFRFGVIFGVDDRWMKCFISSFALGKPFHPAVINPQKSHLSEKNKPFIA